MELHRQQCQNCGSYGMRNILVRQPGALTQVYARCADCGELVALYELSDYYHQGKGLESYLRSRGAGAADSGRRMLAEFREVKENALRGFEAALEQLRREGKET